MSCCISPPSTSTSMDSSWLAPHRDAFLNALAAQGYADGTMATFRRMVPRDMEASVNDRLLDSGRVTGKLEHSGVSSGGTTIGELAGATENPARYMLGQGGMQIAREAAATGAYAAAPGAVFGGALSSIQNTYAHAQGEIGKKAAASNVVDNTVRFGMRSGAAGVLGTVIRHGAGKAGLVTLHKANVANAVAAGAIEAGAIVKEYACGRISADEAAERLGQTGCTTVSGIYFGAWTGAVFGPVGAVVGSVAGYLLAAVVYQCCVREIREGKQSQESVARVAALGHEAARVLGLQRGEMEGGLADVPSDMRARFGVQITVVDRTLIHERKNEVESALGRYLKLIGDRLAK